MQCDIEQELLRAAEQYGFWIGTMEPYVRNTLPFCSAKNRRERYKQQAEHQHRMLKAMEETNQCMHVVMGFGKEASAPIFFHSPWRNRFRSCPDYVAVGQSVWTMHATSWWFRHQWLKFFDRYRDDVRKTWMTDKESRVLSHLPRPFEMYRGYNKPRGKMGMSWTLDKNVAAKIPRGLGRGALENPWIITAVAKPDDVIAYLNDRHEREIVIDPRRILRVLKDEPAPAPVPVFQRRRIGPCTGRPQKLTKKVLFSLPDGAFVVSEWFLDSRSVFAERLGPSETREEAWRRAVKAKAAGRHGQILSTHHEFLCAKHGMSLKLEDPSKQNQP